MHIEILCLSVHLIAMWEGVASSNKISLLVQIWNFEGAIISFIMYDKHEIQLPYGTKFHLNF